MRRTPGYPCPRCCADYCPAIMRIWLKAFNKSASAVRMAARAYRSLCKEVEDWEMGEPPEARP